MLINPGTPDLLDGIVDEIARGHAHGSKRRRSDWPSV